MEDQLSDEEKRQELLYKFGLIAQLGQNVPAMTHLKDLTTEDLQYKYDILVARLRREEQIQKMRQIIMVAKLSYELLEREKPSDDPVLATGVEYYKKLVKWISSAPEEVVFKFFEVYTPL